MPKYLFVLPENLNGFIQSKSSNEQQAELITLRLVELITDGEKSLTKKSQGNQFFYTFNIDIGKHAHRAIFEKVLFDNRAVFLLRTIAWMHNYDAALRWQPLSSVNHAQLEALYADYGGYQTLDSAIVADIQEDHTGDEGRAIYYRGRSLVPTSLQAEILYPQSASPLSMPMILVGPPGSGKTLIGMGFLQEWAMSHSNNNDPNPLSLCYVAESRALVEQQQAHWRDFAAQSLTRKANEVITAHFYTVEDYARQYAQSTNHKFVGGIEAKTLLEKHLDKDTKEHQELYHNAWRIYLDFKETKSFNASLYRETGASNSFYSAQTAVQQEKRYAKYLKLMQELEQKKEFLFGVSSMQTHQSKPQEFDFTVIDEAQRINPVLLQGFMQATNQHNVLVIGDPYQKGSSPFSSLDALRALTGHCFKCQMPYHQLPSSLRVQPDVAKVLDNVVLLYTHVIGGKADAISYSSLQLDDAIIDDGAMLSHVHLLQAPLPSTSQKQLAALGTNAHAAALVLNAQDKQQAGTLINSHNVFTAKEVLGLEFSQILLYLSENTLKQFTEMSILMNEQGIKPGQTLQALQHKPAQKSAGRGVMQELLSDLLVALSRSQATLYVVCELPEKTHKLKYFLDWFKACLGGVRAEIQINAEYHTGEDWLHAINEFIRANALPQAKNNLQSKFMLTDTQADAYILWCQQSTLTPGLAELQHWLNLEPSAALPVSITETAHSESESNDVISWEELHERIAHDGASAIEPYLTHPQAAEQLFKPLSSLWVNISLNHFDILRSLFSQKNTRNEMLINEGFQYAKATKDQLLLVCLALVVPKHALAGEAKVALTDLLLMHDKPELQAQLVANLSKSSYLSILTKDDFFNLKTVGSPQLVHVLLRHQAETIWKENPNFKAAVVDALTKKTKNAAYVNAPGIYQGHNLINWLLHSVFGYQFIIDSKSLIIKNWNSLFGKACPGALYHLCQQEKWIELLNNYLYQTTDNYFSTFFIPVTEGVNKGKRAFSLLFEHESGLIFISKHLKFFATALQKADTLFTSVTDDRGTLNVMPFHKLCDSSVGIDLLDKQWPYYSTYLKNHPELWFKPVRGDGVENEAAAFFRLLRTEKGRLFICNHWYEFFPVDNPDWLFTPFMEEGPHQGMTVFYYLCSRDEGISILMTRLSDYSSYLSTYPDLWFAPVMGSGQEQGKTPLLTLCRSSQGLPLLSKHWSELFPNDDLSILFTSVIHNGTEQGMTGFITLCNNKLGMGLLKKQWTSFSAYFKAHPNILFDPEKGDSSATNGMTLFYRLCSSYNGPVLLYTYWSELYPQDRPELFFASPVTEGLEQGMTAFYKLCSRADGVNLLLVYWSDLSVYLKTHLDLLFTPIMFDGAEMSRPVFHHLCAREIFRNVFSEFIQELDEPQKQSLMGLINVFIKDERVIEEYIQIWLRQLQPAQETNPHRFFPSAQPNNEGGTDLIEAKPKDLGN